MSLSRRCMRIRIDRSMVLLEQQGSHEVSNKPRCIRSCESKFMYRGLPLLAAVMHVQHAVLSILVHVRPAEVTPVFWGNAIVPPSRSRCDPARWFRPRLRQKPAKPTTRLGPLFGLRLGLRLDLRLGLRLRRLRCKPCCSPVCRFLFFRGLRHRHLQRPSPLCHLRQHFDARLLKAWSEIDHVEVTRTLGVPWRIHIRPRQCRLV